VEKFRQLDALPVAVAFEDETTDEFLLQNKAKWHKACHLKFSQSKRMGIIQQRRRKREYSPTDNDRKVKPRSRNTPDEQAFICCAQTSGTMHLCSTMRLEHELRKMAEELQDTIMISKTAGGDLIAIDAKYHLNCLASYKNRYRSFIRSKTSSQSQNEDKLLLAHAFVELVSYIESNTESGNFIFKLSLLHNLYESRRHSFGVEKSINITRLKKKLLEHFSGEYQEQSDGKTPFLVFNDSLKAMLKESINSRDFGSESISMAKLAKIIRREIFEWDTFNFSGKFGTSHFKNIHIYDTQWAYLENQDATESQECLTLSQLVHFNVKYKAHTSEKNRHSKCREPPLPLYIGLSIHTLTRSKKMSVFLHTLGISISYNRVLELENLFATAMCKQFRDEGVVCPANLHKRLFVVGAQDNIDHKPSSTTSQGSFVALELVSSNFQL